MADNFTLYKFRGLGERTLSILERGELWHSHPSDLNDSWEFRVPFYVSLTPVELVTHVRQRFSAEQASVQLLDKMMLFAGGKSIPVSDDFTRRFLGADHEHVALYVIALTHFLAQQNRSDAEIAQALQLTPGSALHRRVERELREAYAANQDMGMQGGVLSLSRLWDEPLMWAHYADAGRGVCIGIEFSTEQLLHSPMMPLSVRYVDTPPVVDVDDFFDRQHDPDGEKWYRMMVAFYATKHSSWKYEEEFRLFSPHGNRTYPVPGRISEIILGDRTPTEAAKRLVELASGMPGVRLYKLIRKHTEWGFVRARLTDEAEPGADPNLMQTS